MRSAVHSQLKIMALALVMAFTCIFFAYSASAEPLITRDKRIKQYGDKISAVVPFYQWYLDKYDLTKDDLRELDYPFASKFGSVEPFMMNSWGEGTDKRVKLSITYPEVPTYDVITIKGNEITIKYVSQEEFLKSSQ
jgi:hypothetical protein